MPEASAEMQKAEDEKKTCLLKGQIGAQQKH